MSHLVKIKVRADQLVHFPGICVHCAQPAAQWIGLRKRTGQITRTIDLPLCSDCQHQLQTQTGEEERLRKLGVVATGVIFLLTLAIALLLTPATMEIALRLLVALLLAISLGQLMLLAFKRARVSAASSEKKAIMASAKIAAFSWRATTFQFSNETFTERFEALNKPLLMEI